VDAGHGLKLEAEAGPILYDPRRVPDLAWAPVPSQALDVPGTLTSGQVFRWSVTPDGRWLGSIGEVVVLLEPHARELGWATWPPGRWEAVSRFLALHVDLRQLCSDWVRRDPAFQRYVHGATGLRVLRQPAEGALIAFLCSSCNNVPRISRMLNALACAVGADAQCPWAPGMRLDATLADIRRLDERSLRDLGFGYRARYLRLVAAAAAGWPDGWLDGFANRGYLAARSVLTALPGVGLKVADCVCLFGLGMHDIVPVDTHIARYARRRLAPDMTARSLTPKAYDALASRLRGIMGPYAGWAQQYVFVRERLERQPGRPRGESHVAPLQHTDPTA